MKLVVQDPLKFAWCRPPCGGRGLKHRTWIRVAKNRQSPPVRGARIETLSAILEANPDPVAPRAGGAD